MPKFEVGQPSLSLIVKKFLNFKSMSHLQFTPSAPFLYKVILSNSYKKRDKKYLLGHILTAHPGFILHTFLVLFPFSKVFIFIKCLSCLLHISQF